jgi:hypothetical protein
MTLCPRYLWNRDLIDVVVARKGEIDLCTDYYDNDTFPNYAYAI